MVKISNPCLNNYGGHSVGVVIRHAAFVVLEVEIADGLVVVTGGGQMDAAHVSRRDQLVPIHAGICLKGCLCSKQ